MSKEIAEEYASSLADLTVNSKPLINMLTILAEENINHAGVIVETVEKHLEKVSPEIKLPVLYLVDSIIKNVGGEYTQKFSQSIVNMFTKTFKQVDEKIRSQMFKLRETWHDVFPATKLYQLDVKVNLIDPAWPIQAQPHQSTIHNLPTTSAAPVPIEEEDKMRNILAKKEQELLMLQRKKIEMELEQTRRQLEIAEKNVKKVAPVVPPAPAIMPVALVNPQVAPAAMPETVGLPAKSRLGPPVNKPTNRIAPVSGALAGARRDPRLARRPALAQPAPLQTVIPTVPTIIPQIQQVPIAPNVFDIKPLDRVTKRKNVITIDVNPETIEQIPPTRDPRRRDPRFDKRQRTRVRDRDERKIEDDKRKLEIKEDKIDRKIEIKKIEEKDKKEDKSIDKIAADKYIDKMIGPEKKVKLPPIPKINRDDVKDKDSPSPVKRKKELTRTDKKKKRESDSSKESSSNSSPEKKTKATKDKQKIQKQKMEVEEKPDPEIVSFKELKNYHKERYMRRNKEHSESPEVSKEEDKPTETESSNVQEVVTESKDVDLRVLPIVEKAAPISQKRPSTETLAEGKIKKNKLDKFDILFGNEDVDLRQLPQVEETPVSIPMSPKVEDDKSPQGSPKKDWHEIKEKEEKKTPTKLDLVRAKLAEATKGKDRLGRPLLFTKACSEERERRRTLSSEDTDLRNENPEDFDAEDHKKTISIIMSQAKEQYSDGQLDKGQYNALMYQVLQLNEKLKLKEAKQRESLEISKRKLNKFNETPQKVVSPKSDPNTFGDIDERITPAVFMDTPPDSQSFMKDSDMRMNVIDSVDGPPQMIPPRMPMFMGPYWRGQPRPRVEEYVPRGPAPMFRGQNPQFFRGQFDARIPRPNFEPRMPMQLPVPQIGMGQGECPIKRYERCSSPPPLGSPAVNIPPTDIQILEYIDQDPVKTIQIDGVPREIRFYGESAVIMLDWDDPREIKFLPGCRRVTFDNKDSVVLSFNDPYKQVEIDDQVFDIRFGAPTRELYINRRWFECFFGGQPLGVLIDGKARLVHLEGPLPQVDIGKVKRTDLVAGKINLIVNATQMCPVYLDAKVQKIAINGHFFTIRFVDALRTVLINEQPFKVEFGDLPKPIFVGNEKFFIRFSALPRNVKPGYVQIANMEGTIMPIVQNPQMAPLIMPNTMEVDPVLQRPAKTPSPEGQGLDMLASVMPLPTNIDTPASASEYILAEPLFSMPNKIPGLEASPEEKPTQLPILGNINVTDLFAKLVATGMVRLPNDNNEKEDRRPKEDKTVIRKVDLLKSETLRVKQPGVVTKLYGGMQCSGCGTRFPPEHTVRYSQHLDWHFRQNRRERDSARRPHSRQWHYDLADWLNYEELEDADEREKSWFESGGLETPSEREEEIPSTPAVSTSTRCGLCGDNFDQFYNEDKEEWHLRNAVIFEYKNYHPVCLEDYKASLAKESEKTKLETKEEASKEEGAEDKTEEGAEEKIVQEQTEPIDIDADEAKSDSECEVEVIEEKNELVEIDEEADEDDVVFKAEPVEQLTVEDEDTDDETSAIRKARDDEVDFTKVKVKQEPIDPDDEPIITAEEEATPTTIDTTISTTTPTITYSIDGNVQLEAPTPATTLPIGGIRINISKSIPTIQNNNLAPIDDGMLEDVSADDEPLPPGEELELEYKLKPGLEGVQFSRQPPVQKGNDLSGLCSIM